MPTARARSPYSRQLVERQMPSVFSRNAIRPSRARTWCQNSLGMVSQPSISIFPTEPAWTSAFMSGGPP